MDYEVIGMAGTLDCRIVPVETPHAEPWYKVRCWISEPSHQYIMLTDGDKYCWEIELDGGPFLVYPQDFSPLNDNPLNDMLYDVRDAIKRYHKEIDV